MCAKSWRRAYISRQICPFVYLPAAYCCHGFDILWRSVGGGCACGLPKSWRAVLRVRYQRYRGFTFIKIAMSVPRGNEEACASHPASQYHRQPNATCRMPQCRRCGSCRPKHPSQSESPTLSQCHLRVVAIRGYDHCTQSRVVQCVHQTLALSLDEAAETWRSVSIRHRSHRWTKPLRRSGGSARLRRPPVRCCRRMGRRWGWP